MFGEGKYSSLIEVQVFQREALINSKTVINMLGQFGNCNPVGNGGLPRVSNWEISLTVYTMGRRRHEMGDQLGMPSKVYRREMEVTSRVLVCVNNHY